MHKSNHELIMRAVRLLVYSSITFIWVFDLPLGNRSFIVLYMNVPLRVRNAYAVLIECHFYLGCRIKIDRF